MPDTRIPKTHPAKVSKISSIFDLDLFCITRFVLSYPKISLAACAMWCQFTRYKIVVILAGQMAKIQTFALQKKKKHQKPTEATHWARLLNMKLCYCRNNSWRIRICLDQGLLPSLSSRVARWFNLWNVLLESKGTTLTNPNSPLIRPYFLGGGGIGGPLRFPWNISVVFFGKSNN